MTNPQRQVLKATTSTKSWLRWKTLGLRPANVSDTLPRTVMLELLADVLRDNLPPESRAKYEFRKYAGQLVFALSLISIEIVSRPRVVALRRVDRRSTALTRQTAQRAWSKRLDETGDQVAALEAAVRETLAREPHWSLQDAIRHAVAFVLP